MLYKIGSTLKILKTAAVAEDLLTEKPVTEKTPNSTKIVEPKNSDFLYYRARAISAGDQGPLSVDGSRGFNYNGNYDYFPRKELEKSFDTFVGRNIFLDHNSSSSLYSIGKIIDAVPVDDHETGEFYIELIGKIDRTLHPEICRKIETGELNATSMGCSVDESKCSVCAHVLHSDADDKCEHLSALGLGKKYAAEVDVPEFNIHKGDPIPAFSINSGIVFNEDSIVGVPADSSAVIKTVFSNMKHQLNKKATLTKEEQLDLAAQMEKLFEKLDESTKISLKAEFCSICPPVEKEPDMSEKSLPNEDTKKILSKLSALEMEQLESYVAHKTRKANEVVNKEVVAEATKKEEGFLQKVIARVKNSFAAELLEKKVESVAKEELSKEAGAKCEVCEDLRSEKDPSREYDPTCAGSLCSKHEKEYLDKKKASLTTKFSENTKDVLSSTWAVYDGEKLLLDASLHDIWGAQFALLSFEQQKWATSEAYGKEVLARYTQDGLAKLADLWDVTHKISKEAKGPELGPDGSFAKPSTGTNNKKHDYPTEPKIEKPEGTKLTPGKGSSNKEHDVKTEYKIDMPGQEKGQTGPAAPKAKEVKTDYSEPKPEAEGKEVKTTPKNPDEKDAKKSSEEVKTDYVAVGDEIREDKDDKEKSKKESSLLSWASLTPKAQNFIKIAAKKYVESGMKNAEAVAKAHSDFTAQEITMEKKASDKPIETVDGSTLPEGTKEIGDKPEETVDGTTLPGNATPNSDPDTSVDGAKFPKTNNPTVKPEETVDGTTVPAGAKPNSEPEQSVDKKAATEVPAPEMKEEIKIEDAGPTEHETENLSLDAPKVDAPKVEESAFDKTEVLDIGEGYSASKDKATNEIIITKDTQEVKRLPDGFGKEVAEVLKLMKAVLGLPAQEAAPAAPEMATPPIEEVKETVEEHPALEEAHEDELGMKESSLKAKEAALATKEAEVNAKAAELKAKEEATAKEEKTKKFASLLKARAERCQKIVATMVDKDVIKMDEEILANELKLGTYLLDAQKKAFEAAITTKQRELLAMDDNALKATEKVVEELKAPTTVNTKRASKIYLSPQYDINRSEEDELKRIFNSMGTKNRPQ